MSGDFTSGIPRRGYEDLNGNERRAVDSLLRLARRWPDTIGLLSWSGALRITDLRPEVVDAINDRTGFGEVRTIDGIPTFAIPNDGGDPNEFD